MARYPIGDFHIDIAPVSTEEGKLSLFAAIERTSQFTFVRLVESAGKTKAAQSLRDLIAAVPDRIYIARPRGTPDASGLSRTSHPELYTEQARDCFSGTSQSNDTNLFCKHRIVS
ncbi:hypothetical protein Mext_1276 [Methylorubrum extorquens PA1]|nr:hypothetical protein Mext_1276 [Methylorubrum extorquens PA1]